MHKLLTLATLALLISAPVVAAPCRDDDGCQRVKDEIRRIEARMREAYTARQGVKLSARLRELKRRRNKICR